MELVAETAKTRDSQKATSRIEDRAARVRGGAAAVVQAAGIEGRGVQLTGSNKRVRSIRGSREWQENPRL